MDARELAIYNGLKVIGKEIAAFFNDALQIFNQDLTTKPYLLGHLSREIESGLREILSPVNNEDSQPCNECGRRITQVTHSESIKRALGIKEDTAFSKKWHKTAKQFHSFAHRHGVWKSPRDIDEFNSLWEDFLDILEGLIGNYYSIADRLDIIINNNAPSSSLIKSLPNLLTLDSRYSYFFNNLKSVEWLEILYENEYFAGDKNPYPKESKENPGFYYMPFWSVLTYLEKVSQQNFNNPSPKITNILLLIIDAISLFRNDKGKRIENYRTDYSLLKIISNIPSEYLDNRHFEYIIEFFHTSWETLLIAGDFNKLILRKFITENQKDLLLISLSIVFTYQKNNDSEPITVNSVFKHGTLQSTLNDDRDRLLKNCGIDGTKLAVYFMEELLRLNNSLFSVSTLPAIEDHNQTSIPYSYECQLIYFVRDSINSLTNNEQKEIIKLLFNSNFDIFYRLAIYAINCNYEHKSLFLNWNDNPLDNRTCKHEIYELIKNHTEDFLDDEVSLILKWIDQINYKIPKTIENYEDIISRQKREILTALETLENPEVKELMQKYEERDSTPIRHPGFDSWYESIYGNISPYTFDEVNNMELKDIISEFDVLSKKKEDFLGPTLDGFADMVSSVISNDINRFNGNNNEIINAQRHFQYSWCRGIYEGWKFEKEFNLINVFSIIQKIQQSDSFWDNNGDNIKHHYNSQICFYSIGILTKVIQNDTVEYESELFDLIKQLMFYMLDKDLSEITEMMELSMSVLNNNRGKIYSSLIYFSLKKYKQNNKWDEDIINYIEKALNTNENNELLHFVLGQFLPNIEYLNKDWFLENFDKIFSLKNEINWNAAMCGYLFYNSRPYKHHLNLLREKGHVIKGLNHDFKNERQEVIDNLINHICIAFVLELKGFELEEEIFKHILKIEKKEHFSYIIHFFWRHDSPLRKVEIEKIKPLWNLLYDFSKDLSNPELHKFILSGCLKWIKNIENLDDQIYEWILFSIKYLEQHDKYFVIEYLGIHIDSNTERVANILVELFSNEITYDISKGKVEGLVEVIYKNDQKELADKICLLHGEAGFDYLRNIYEHYNSQVKK